MNVNELVNAIGKMEMSPAELCMVFGALRSQKNFVGGKMWTSEDVSDAIDDVLEDDEADRNQLLEKAMKKLKYDEMLDDALNYDTDEEYECLTDAVREAITD